MDRKKLWQIPTTKLSLAIYKGYTTEGKKGIWYILWLRSLWDFYVSSGMFLMGTFHTTLWEIQNDFFISIFSHCYATKVTMILQKQNLIISDEMIIVRSEHINYWLFNLVLWVIRENYSREMDCHKITSVFWILWSKPRNFHHYTLKLEM